MRRDGRTGSRLGRRGGRLGWIAAACLAVSVGCSRHRATAERALGGIGYGGRDETSKCGVLPLILDCLYSGRIAEAWAALDRYYTFDDRETFREEIRATVSGSRYFALPLGADSL